MGAIGIKFKRIQENRALKDFFTTAEEEDDYEEAYDDTELEYIG